MATQKDYYETLGIKRDASEAEIKKAFRRAAAKHHPDQAKGDKKAAEAKFKEISEAYETLSDPQKRTQYDQFGGAGPQFGGGGAGGFGGGGFQGNADFGGGFGDIFEQFFGGGGHPSGRGGHARGPARGADIEARVRIRFTDAIFGTTADFALERALKCEKCKGNGAEPGSKITTCKKCKGTGEIVTTRQTIFGHIRHNATCDDCGGEGKTYEQKCSICHGTGRARKHDKVKVKIPAGVETGAVIRLAGQGEAGAKGGPAGDLFIHIQVESSPEFDRHGSELYSTQKIHLVQAVLGDEIAVKTVHGDVKLKIPAGIQSGTSFKLKNYGAPKLNSSEKGDHIVKILVEIPNKLSKREKELFVELATEAKLKPKGKGGWFGL